MFCRLMLFLKPREKAREADRLTFQFLLQSQFLQSHPQLCSRTPAAASLSSLTLPQMDHKGLLQPALSLIIPVPSLWHQQPFSVSTPAEQARWTGKLIENLHHSLLSSTSKFPVSSLLCNRTHCFPLCAHLLWIPQLSSPNSPYAIVTLSQLQFQQALLANWQRLLLSEKLSVNPFLSLDSSLKSHPQRYSRPSEMTSLW